MRLWIDDIRPAPDGYVWVKNTIAAKDYLDAHYPIIEMIDIDHDAGDYVSLGGDYIRILDYMEHNHYDDIPIHIHSQNPVGVENMRRIIKRNGWKEI